MSVEEDMKCIGYMYIIIRPTGLPTKGLMEFFSEVPGIEAVTQGRGVVVSQRA